MEDQEVQELVSLITDTIKEAVFADDRLTGLVARVDALEASAVVEVTEEVEAPATEEVEAVEEVVEPTPAEEEEAPKISKLQEIINKIKGVK